MEQAYDNLQNILGDRGMERLSDDTKGLVEKQQELMKNLEHFEPLMKQAKKMMEGLSTAGPYLEKMTGLLGSLGGGKKK